MISSMVDIVMIRTFDHQDVETFAANSSVPVINALTDDFHPASSLLICKHGSSIAEICEEKQPAGSATATTCVTPILMRQSSWAFICALPALKVTSPHRGSRGAGRCGNHRARSKTCSSRAHLLVTDVWASMGQEAEASERNNALSLSTQPGAS